MRNNRGYCIKKAVMISSAILLLSSCGQRDNIEISGTLPVGETSATAEIPVTKEQESEAASQTRLETTSETEAESSLTPLEQMYKYCEDFGNKFLLYDFTGDNFPETVEIWGAEWGCDYVIRDLNGNICPIVGNGSLIDSKIYVCSEDGHKYILAYCFSGVSGWEWLTAKRIDFYNNGDISESIVGYAEIYTATQKRYNSEFYFEDSDASPIGFYTYDISSWDTKPEDELTCNMFDEEFEKYLSGCDVIDEINFGSVIGCLHPRNDYADSPNEDHLFEEPDEHIDTDTHYFDDSVRLSEDGKTLAIYMNKLPENFDFEELKSFGDIKELYINGYDLENIEFVKYFPEMEVVHTYFTINDTEVLRPLTELPKLAVVADSGQGSYLLARFLDDGTDEARNRIREMLGDRLWVFLA